MSILYVIGTGPGDKKYLTLEAVERLKESELIFAPQSKGKNMALDTVADWVKEKTIVYLSYPMNSVTEETYKEAAKKIGKEMQTVQKASFVTIGDSTIYSTFFNTAKFFDDSVDWRVVSGIPSFVAAAGAAKQPLVYKGECFLLSDNYETSVFEAADSVALLKTYRDKTALLDLMEEHGFSPTYVSRVSMPQQKICRAREEILFEEDYLSMLLGRKM